MWLAWVAAVVVPRHRRDPTDRIARLAPLAAALVMIAVYLLPHSLRGSQLDYGNAPADGAATGSVAPGR
jgi:hypothetical protein